MAFLRIEKKKSGSYLRIVKTFRNNGKVLHKTLFNLGKKEDYTNDQLQNIGKKLYELGGGKLADLLCDNICELGRFNFGYFQLYSKILKYYGIDKILKKIQKKNNLEINLVNAVLLMLLERLQSPASKRQNYLNQTEYLGIDNIELHQLYRTLDYLADNQQAIQDTIFFTGRDLFNHSLDIVFYDVTTFYFDTARESELLAKGFGKDGKHGKSQIVFGLLIDKDKNPIGYNIYKGDFYEGHTFEDAVKKLKQRYRIDNVIIVADRGMMNRNNLNFVTENKGYEFIVGERLKNLPQTTQEYLTNRDNYKASWIYNSDNEEIKIEYTTIEYQGRKIICTYSEKRAKKDSFERQERISKGKILMENPSLLDKKAHRFYLTKDKQDKLSLNEDKIKSDAKFDGFIAIATNNKDLTETKILEHYKHLYQIEHTFRSFKSHLETRPMFHWTDKRIEGHISLCYIAYTLNIYVINTLNRHNIKMSENDVRKTLSKMQVSLVQQGENELYLRSTTTKNIENLIKVFNLNKLPDITPKSNIINYL